MKAGPAAVEKPKKIRAFIALKTPATWDEQLRELQARLKEQFKSNAFRWVRPEQVHITLRFLGHILPDEAETVAGLLPTIAAAHRGFKLKCQGLGCFPSIRRPRVLWAGLAGDIAKVQALQAAVTEGTQEIGEPPEHREFKPHLTLARIHDLERNAVGHLEKAVQDGFSMRDERMVDELLFMQSHLSPQGARYEPLAAGRLAG